MILLGQRPSLGQLVGGALVLAGITDHPAPVDAGPPAP